MARTKKGTVASVIFGVAIATLVPLCTVWLWFSHSKLEVC